MNSKRTLLFASLSVLGLAVLAFAQASGTGGGIPAGYRQWTHVKSMVIHEKSHPLFAAFGGIHHVYVNAKGAAAARKGGPYPEGTIFVFDLLEANAANGAMTEGKRKVLATMTKDSKKFASTGGWQFQAFAEGDPKKQVVKDAAKECFACHASQKSSDFVYSAWRP